MKSAIPVYAISVPEYTIEHEPDYRSSGSKLDKVIANYFPGRWIAIRGIGLVDHPGKSLQDLVALIQENGTDQYDPNRKGVHAGIYQNFTIHLHATPCLVTVDGLCSPHYEDRGCGSVMGDIMSDFYGGALYDRGYAIRLDILMLYALDELDPVGIEWTTDGPVPSSTPTLPTESCAFMFKHPDQRQAALLGIIKILR